MPWNEQGSLKPSTDVRTQSVSGTSANVDCASLGDVLITATNSPTLTPTGSPTSERMIMLTVVASGGQRVATLASSVGLTRDVTSRVLTIPNGERGFFGMRYSGGTWWLLAVTVSV